MEDRLKNLEVEIAYLQKDIGHLIDLIENMKPENHTYYTNVYYSKEYLDSLTEAYN